MNRILIGFIAVLGVSLVHAQASPAPSAPRAGPGGTSMISPTPGPATSPALPSANTPEVTLANKEKAKADRAERQAQKKAKKAKKTTPATQ